MPERKGKVPGLKLLLEGEPGTGKTYSTRTLPACGLKSRLIFLDASQVSVESLPMDGPTDLQWKHIKPPQTAWSDLQDMFTSVHNLSNKALQSPDSSAIALRSQTQMLELLTVCNKYISDRNGKDYGDILTWGTDTVLVIDGLSKLTNYALRMSVGLKPILTIVDWGVVQNVVRNFLQPLVDNLWCHFVLISHIDREIDEIKGGTRKVPATAGRKLGPRIPELFDDVIMAYRTGNKFLWRTYGDDDAMTKGRSVGLINDVPADYKIVLDAWKARGGVIEP